MSFVRSIEDVTPPAREDGLPWTKALFQEAPSPALDDEWVTIETFTLDPEDPDPSQPVARSFTTEAGTQEPAYYRIVWEDADGDTAPDRAEYWPELPAWGPTVADVSALIRARTKVRGGKEMGIFNERTVPTATQVERLIRQASRRVASKIGADPCTDELRMDAGAAAALYAAMLVEQSYYPEQTTNATSSFASLEKLWKDAIGDLSQAVRDTCGGEDEGASGGPLAAGSFDDGHGLISRGNPPAW